MSDTPEDAGRREAGMPTYVELLQQMIDATKESTERIRWDNARFERLAKAIIADNREHGYRGEAWRALSAILEET